MVIGRNDPYIYSHMELSSAQYYGKLVGPLTLRDHDVMGTVYVINRTALRVIGFNYSGNAPDAHFYVGFHRAGNGSRPVMRGGPPPQPDTNGIVVPTTKEGSSPLGAYSDSDVILSLPREVGSVTEVLWLSVWCVNSSVNFGHIIFPTPPIDPPGPHNLGEMSTLAHGVQSGNISIEDTKTITINDLFYDGEGPDAYFMVGFGGEPGPNGTKVPDEMGSCGKLRKYEGQDVTLTLPGNLTVFNISWLSMYCIQHTHNFGHVNFPTATQLNVPPYMPGTNNQVTEGYTHVPVTDASNVTSVTDAATSVSTNSAVLIFMLTSATILIYIGNASM